MWNRFVVPLLVVPAFLASSSLFAQTAASQEAVPAPQEYIGTETCRLCHEDQYANYRKSVHFQTITGNYEVSGCEACHGPGAQHALTAGEADLIFMPSRANVTVKEKVDVCLKCHQGRENTFNFREGEHMKGTIDCSTCHKPHEAFERPSLLPEATHELCLSCHQEKVAQVNLNERHRILEGMVECTDCHNQHGPNTRARLGGFKQEVCVKCHTDKQGPWIFEHEAVRIEGCTACHEPHGSVNRHMLAFQSTAELCFSCHAAVPGFHTRFNPTTNCTNCHTAIHGSNLHEMFLQ